MRVDGTQTCTFFFSSSFSSSVSLSVSVNLCANFLQFQGLICGVESRWKANCQRQCRRHHQDLGLAIWRLPVDGDRALAPVSFFPLFFLYIKFGILLLINASRPHSNLYVFFFQFFFLQCFTLSFC